jgi:outer membrane protein assembly factor BamB
VVGGSDPDLASSPAIGTDGTIYVGETVDVGGEADGLVLGINPDGTLKWQHEDSQGGYARTPPAICKGQRIYAGSLGGFLAIGP